MNRSKYPRTHHLPWSLGATSDDKTLASTAHFDGVEVVVTEKCDGENTTIYADGYTHARSLDSNNHPSRNQIRALAARIATEGLPSDLRICGENVTAKHAIHYTRLTSVFYVFSIWKGDDCLSWDETVEWCELLNLPTVPVLYRGVWNEKEIKALWTGRSAFGDVGEGYVVRVTAGFKRADFSKSLAKYVRANHVAEGTEHWAHTAMVPNVVVSEA